MTQELEEYILSHISAEPPQLAHIQRRVGLQMLYPRMCSGHLQGRLLAMLTAMVAPHRVLEVGTYAGYSTLSMAEGLAEGGVIDTVEIDDEMEPFLRRRFDESPYAANICLHIGDFAQVAASLSPGYDLAYLDANKRTYCETFNLVRPLMRQGAFVIADNTLWDGKVLSAEAHDAQTEGIRRFNDMVAADPTLQKVILPLRDGITLIRILPPQ